MIIPDDSSLPFTFKPEDASKWVNVVAAILRRLDIAFPGGRAEDDPGPAPDKDTLSQVNLDIFDLALLSEFEPLDSILAHTSLTKRFRSTSCPRTCFSRPSVTQRLTSDPQALDGTLQEQVGNVCALSESQPMVC